MYSFFCNNWTDIIVAFIGAFFGFGLALLIEYWNIRQNIRKEKRISKEEMAKKIEYYSVLLEEVVTKTQKQVELLENNIEIQDKNLLYPIPLRRIPTNFFTRLKNIDGRGVFEALTDKFKNDKDWIKKYNNLNSYLDFLEGALCEELVRINKKTIEKGYEDQLFIKKLIDEIPNILSRAAFEKKQELHDSRFEDAEYVLINNAILIYRQLTDERADLEQFNTDLLEPLLQSLATYEAQSYAIDVTFNCKNARVRMTDIKSDVSHTLSTYKEIIGALTEPIAKVKEMIALLNS